MTTENRLPKAAYTGQDWFELEQDVLFRSAWRFVGVTGDFNRTGDYLTTKVGRAPLAVIQDSEGRLRAFHNICRHRGATLLDGDSGNAGGTLVCPYHRWTYGLDGALRGMPNRSACFPGLDRAAHGLKPAAAGVFNDLIFVNPDPDASFADWIAPIRGAAWPHDLAADDVKEAAPLLYELKCNWKVFVENAIDGYHLAYLHEHTLGGPAPDQNVWTRAGAHMIWHAAEDGARHRLPAKFRDDGDAWSKIASAAEPGYGGVYFLFPATLIVPTPYGFSVSSLQPIAPDRTRLVIRNWVGPWQSRDERDAIPGYDKTTGVISSDNWTDHPLETGDFQTEDVWISEKVQEGLASPAYEHGPLAQGPGAEDPIRWLHESLTAALAAPAQTKLANDARRDT